MTRTKFRLLIAISVLCQGAAFFIRYYNPKDTNLQDFLSAMGLTIMVGAMIIIVRKTRLR